MCQSSVKHHSTRQEDSKTDSFLCLVGSDTAAATLAQALAVAQILFRTSAARQRRGFRRNLCLKTLSFFFSRGSLVFSAFAFATPFLVVGDVWVVLNGLMLNVSHFLSQHPG